MGKVLLVLAILGMATVAAAYDCEGEAEVAAAMAVEKHEGGLSVVDRCTAYQTIYQKEHHAIVWLQARYMDEDRPTTQWCVLITLPTKCPQPLFGKPVPNAGPTFGPRPTAKEVVSCKTVPDEEGIRRLLKSVGWAK